MVILYEVCDGCFQKESVEKGTLDGTEGWYCEECVPTINKELQE